MVFLSSSPWRLRAAVAALTMISLSGCSRLPATPDALPSGVTAGPWRSLFDGSTGAHWRGYRSDRFPEGWSTQGALTLERSGGDLVSVEQYGDFELELEWRISAGGNSGVFFRGTEAADRIYETAPEMQVLDDTRHPDGRNPKTSAGSNFALIAPVGKRLLPVGEWNRARLVVVGPHVEHWLNGVKVVEYELWSDEWKGLVAQSKFAAWPGYGLARRGHIALQDHGDPVSFRNIRIRELSR